MAETAPVKTQTQTQKPTSFLHNSDELKKVFDQFDINKDGKLSVTELRSVMKAMGSSVTESELKQVMEDIDHDRDGFISISEFESICRSTDDGGGGGNSGDDLREAFDLYDHNKNGLISSAELNSVLGRLGLPCSAEDCCRMIELVDVDGDGNVNFEEFKKMMSKSLGSNSS